MADLTAFCESVERTSIAQAMANSSWLFPAVATIHLTAMALLVGSISAFDLRLLGLILTRERVSRLAERLLPFTWSAFAIMAITGFLLFGSDPVHKYCPNPSFRIKLVLIALAGVNMSIFHLTVYRTVHKWDTARSPPLWAKMVGTFSVALWAGVIIAGRWVGFI
jgi:MFS superfamily sulfate permease-like transporter